MPTATKEKGRAKEVAKHADRTRRRTKRVDIDVDLVLLLDASGSMSPLQLATIEAVNAYREEQAGAKGRTWVSLFLFDSIGNGTLRFVQVFVRRPIEEVGPLTAEVYRPNGGTPLYDAIGATVEVIEAALAAASTPSDKVLVTIFTDGQENSSHEFDRGAVHALIERKRSEGWDFAYMGANHDAVHAASLIAIPKGYARGWKATPEGVSAMMASTSGGTQSYRQAVTASVNEGTPMATASPTSFPDEEDES